MSDSAGSRWAGRRVLVTGTTGFKGAWLALLLRELGAEVVGVAMPPHTDPSLFDLLDLGTRIQQHEVDLLRPGGFSSVLDAAAPEVVFHLAAQALVRRGFEQPVLTYETNALGTVQVLEAVRGCEPVRAVVNVTTDKVYVEVSGTPHDEDGRLGGRGPYSGSKVCSEVVTATAYRAWAESRGLGLATARSGNTLGGGDWADDRLVPDCVRACARGEDVRIRNPGAVRPWQHVLDVLWGYLLLAEELIVRPSEASGPWNFGPPAGGEPNVETLARAVLEGLGRPEALVVHEDPDGPRETEVLRLESGKARSRLGWRPLLSWQESVDWTARWYAELQQGGDASSLCNRDLSVYLDRAASLHSTP